MSPLSGSLSANQRAYREDNLTSQRTTVPFQYCYLVARGNGKWTRILYSNVSISMQSSDFQIGERGMLKCCHNQRMTFESINFRFQSAYSDKLPPLEQGAGGEMSPSAHPYFYLLYWQPLICNIAKILNRHRRYLDPRSSGTQARPLSVTLSWLLTRSQHFPPLPAHMSNIAPPSHIYQIFLLMKFEDFSPLPLETKFNRRK